MPDTTTCTHHDPVVRVIDEHGSEELCGLCAIRYLALAGRGVITVTLMVSAPVEVTA